jgi:xanthine dehydrogenase accessory factor
MREQRQIVQRWHQGSGSILVTLIRVQGSSYRQPGAHLLVCKDGSYEGSISAGCLEADLLRKASWLIREGAAVERYSTLFDEAAEMPFGLGCGGVIDLLLESVDTPECEALLRAIEHTLTGCEHYIATWLPRAGRGMQRAVFAADGELLFASNDLSPEALSQARAKCLHHLDPGDDDLAIQRLTPPQRLFVFGAGDDARPLVTMAASLGWNVTVIDGRSHLARKDRFPEPGVEVLVTTTLPKIQAHDAAVVMTHSYEQDKDYLALLLPLQPRYLGLLGSRRRSALLIAETAARIDWSVSECCEHIAAPAGLDIGGEGPEAIALAILSEAQATCMGKRDESRKLSAERVEHYVGTSDATSHLQTQCGLNTI